MENDLDIMKLIYRGGIIHNVEGSSAQEVYKEICGKISVPSYIDKENLFSELCQRENTISTAIGNGISLPHPTHPLMKDIEDQQITVCYLKNPIDMKALDHNPIKTMFIILTSDQKSHLKILSKLACAFQEKEVVHSLQEQPDFEILQEIFSK